ncbi:septum formation family protein [Demequina salsinemoris]|uniref:septum formation family protein n=1 Tax=Demequina salsinemoris TaxID=577470 RepID=UPI000784E910|nr:septum formation family protein [Demequina salsinemoris]
MDDVDTIAPAVPRRRAAVAGLGAAAVAVWGFVAWPIVSAWVANAHEVPDTTADATSGACFDLPDDASDPGDYASLVGVTSVACDDAHDGQYYATGSLADDASGAIDPDGAYPGVETVRDAVTATCTAADLVETLDSAAYDMDVQVYFPSEESWGEGDRAWACAVVDAESPVTGSVLAG